MTAPCWIPIVMALTRAAVAAGGKPGKAPPLPKPAGVVIHVRTAQELARALSSAQAGQTILLADGLYDVARLWPLRVSKDNLTLRGASGNPAKVILRGKGFKTHDRKEEMIKIEAQGVTVADLTLRDVGCNGIKLQTGSNHGLLVHNVHFVDIGERAIKGPHAPESRNGVVRYCLFEQITPITPDIPGLVFRGDYVAGMDMMHIDGWRIHDNTFKNIRGMHGGGRGAIFFWQGSRNCIVERNTFIGCDRSICYGNPSGKRDMTGGIIRNNFICAGASQAIEICHATGVKVHNNSIYRVGRIVDRRTISVLDVRNVDFRNNIVFSPSRTIWGKGHTEANNLWFSDPSLARRFFVNPAAGDLHLKPTATEAIDKGLRLADVKLDWDGDRRSGPPDIGADELGASPSPGK